MLGLRMSDIDLNALRDCIYRSLESLGQGIVEGLDKGKDNFGDDKLAKKIMDESLVIVFQIIFILMTEGRSILIRMPNNDGSLEGFESNIRLNITNISDSQKVESGGCDGFNLHKSLTHNIHSLVQEKGLTGIVSSMLFSPSFTPLLNDCNLADCSFQEVIQSLCTTGEEDEKESIDWATRTIADVGSVYQSIMELQAVIDWEKMKFSVEYGDENDRKNTGSFYTAEELITEIIDMSVTPYLDSVIESARERFGGAVDGDVCGEMITDVLEQLSIVDSACGYGPFLTKTLNVIAIKLADIQSGEGESSDEDLMLMRGRVAERCIYGIDINPISVELTKIAIWFEADNSNHPLPKLEQRIKLGNSLLGNKFSRAGIIPENAISSKSFKKRYEHNVKHIYVHHTHEIDKQIKDLSKSSLSSTKGGYWSDLQSPEYLQQENIKKRKKKKEMATKISERRGLLKKVPLTNIAQSLVLEIFETIYSSPDNSSELNWAKEFFNATIAPYWWENKEIYGKKAPHPLSSDEMERYAHWLAGKYELKYNINKASNKQQDERFGKVRERVKCIAKEQLFFHWELEFLDVFSFEEGLLGGGFGCSEGNPPYIGGSKISGATSVATANFLRDKYDGGAKADLASYFLRDSFDNLEDGGWVAFVTTNAIASGETRECGLAYIVNNGGSIINAQRGIDWPGDATVTVDLVGVCKGAANSAILNGKKVERISSRLDLRPEYNLGDIDGRWEKRQRGVNPRGKFQIKEEGVAEEFIVNDERNARVVVPFLSGDDINKKGLSTSFIVNFADMSEADAREYDGPFTYVEGVVKPWRESLKNKKEYVRLKKYWWQFEFPAPKIRKWFGAHTTAFAKSRHATRWIIVRIESGSVCSEGTYVFFFEDGSDFAVLQSSIHEHWSRVLGSTLGSAGHRYTNVCFDPFPFPQDPSEEAIEQANLVGEKYMQMRQKLIKKRKCTFNDLQSSLDDANCKDKDILKYRQLTVELDESVLAMYGWEDIEYSRDMQIDGKESRFWPKEEVIELVLERLIELNHALTN
jgi:hypothetical protein